MQTFFKCLVFFCVYFGLAFPAEACRIVPIPPVPPEPPVIVPRPSVQPITVKQHRFEVDIKNGVAVTTLESIFYNPNANILEGTYLFPLPEGASVSNFSMWIDGKEMAGELLDADKARNLYISIVRRMIDPGLLEFVGRQTFKMRIFPIPARGEKRVKLSYTQILPADGNLVRYVYPLTTVGNGREDILGELVAQVKIRSDVPLKSVFSPSHKVEIIKKENEATITYEGKDVHPAQDFVLYFSRSDKMVDLSLVPYKKVDEDGHFLLMLAPRVNQKDSNPKDVVFVFDTSGSMAGENIKKAQAALKYCLNAMRSGDRFNIIPFSTEARPYKDKLLDVNDDSIKKALDFVDKEIYARGGTNIEEALRYALEMGSKDKERPLMVVFLTDGKPTIGIRDPEIIIAGVKKQNIANLRLFAFGVGSNLNIHFLDRLAEENRGTTEYLGSGEDIEVKISSFFDKVSLPVLSNIEIKFPSVEGLRITEVYPRTFSDLFAGGQLTMLGRYSGHDDQAIRVKGMVAGQEKEFVYEINFPKENKENDQVPRLWAIRKIGFLLDQIRLNGESKELKDEVVQLAKKYGIVTPYTSYLVLEDNLERPASAPISRTFVPEGADEDSLGVAPRKEYRKSIDRMRSAMEAKGGTSAVETSRELKNLKEAVTTGDYQAKDKKERANYIRKIAEKTFYLTDGVWQDSEYKKGKSIRIRYLSEEYFELLKQKKGIGKFLAVGPQVIVVFQGKTYEIYN